MNARVTLDRTGLIRHTDYAAPGGEQETEATIGKKEACGFLRWVLDKLDVLFWDIDWGGGDGEPLCSLRLEMNRGADKVVTFYHRLPDEAVALYWALVECL